ncbi:MULTISPECIES: tetratricopeptide repeat protein [unclassified Synechocystis]|uniref:tetratricopeptide repeat protein n=1 Tax=unclassified Synechocystis TaxID=2640012 RepID=UPI0003F9BEDF|nr:MULTISPECIES: tetratricopeptide repeat protein [unclassified Synechocystis]AIE75938.1 hypothetical protein D082_34100 [Synechocystis sp. PCC 6714]MCT0255145.1 tetratricopeptide repeat protein [Synechocystis sp. CS-94]
MQKFFQRIWQWIQQLFAPLVGGPGPRHQSPEDLPPLSDTDYEFLFNQLLEGIAHGWHEGRILKFFQQLDQRCRPRQWLDWLDRFQATVLESPSPNLVLAARMMRLGELAQSFPQIAPIGDKSQHIGRQLYARQAPPQMDTVWEYDGPDLVSAEQGQTQGQMETYTFDELVQRLPKDAGLVAHFAGFLGIDSNDPQVILEALMEKFAIPAEMLTEALNHGGESDLGPVDSLVDDQGHASALVQDELLPIVDSVTVNGLQFEENQEAYTAEDWLNLGIKQAQRGELETAIASWGEAINLDPQLTSAWQNRGSALGVLGQLSDALVNFDQALAQNPDDAQVWLSRGLLLEAMERTEEAIPSYEKALALEPALPEARERLEELQGFLPQE